jgi:hypothetical protein
MDGQIKKIVRSNSPSYFYIYQVIDYTLHCTVWYGIRYMYGTAGAVQNNCCDLVAWRLYLFAADGTDDHGHDVVLQVSVQGFSCKELLTTVNLQKKLLIGVPNPEDFGPLGSGSVSQRYGSGSGSGSSHH